MRTIYAVTGAAGHLGGHVVEQLLARGDTVRGFLLPGEACGAYIGANRHLLTDYIGDVRQPASLDPLFEREAGAELVVIHCAGIIAITGGTNPRMAEVNVQGTANVIDACRRHGVKRLVYTSSVHAIPLMPQGQVMREVDFFDPDTVHGAYDKTKAAATRLVLDAARSGGLDAVIVHPAGIIGPHALPTGFMGAFIASYLRGKFPAVIPGGFDFVDVRDVAAGILAAADHGRAGECYILSNRFIGLRELFDLLSEVSGRRKVKLTLPLWVAQAAAPLAELYYLLANKTPFFTRYALRTLTQNSLFSHKKASRELGYTPRPLRDTLLDIARWLQAEAAREKAAGRRAWGVRLRRPALAQGRYGASAGRKRSAVRKGPKRP